ncbi:MAG: hypothetical protein NTX36_10920 [Proteobacteria bacterium]|nr:hypothetical protein [Pseudomonadota bacterium]
MLIDKIGSINTTYTRASPKRQQPVPDKTENISVGNTGGAKDLLKTISPPFFPICVTQSMFKIVK